MNFSARYQLITIRWMAGFAVLALLLLSTRAHARVFSFTGEGFAPYIRGDYQSSSLGQTPFSKSSGGGNQFDKDYKFVSNYEFGFTYSFRDVALRFGFAVIKPADLKDVTGSNAAGTALFSVDSNVSGYVPKVGIDFILKQWPDARAFMGAEVGLANLVLQNSYRFTPAGQTAYPGLENFREETKGNATQLEYYVGYEFVAFDTTSIVLTGGFRYLKLASFTHGNEVTNFQGTSAKGSDAVDNDGAKRSLDLSGAFASIAFRFWVF